MGGKGFKIGIIVASLSLALVLVIWNSGSSGPSAPEPQMIDLVCESCGEHFQANSTDLEKTEIPGSVPTPEEGQGRSRRTSVPRSLYPCAKCGQPTAVIAHHCETHDKWYPAEAADGGSGKCPDCP